MSSLGGFFELVYAAPHCHAPACEALELYDEDRQELICRGVPIFGGGSDAAHDEAGFIVSIPPCLWGSADEGLRPPPRLHLTSRLACIVRYNATLAHPGAMGLWQMRVALLSSPGASASAVASLSLSVKHAPSRTGSVDTFVVH